MNKLSYKRFLNRLKFTLKHFLFFVSYWERGVRKIMQTDNTMVLKTHLKMSKTMQWTNDPQLLD